MKQHYRLSVNSCFSGDTTPGTPPSSHGSGVALSTLAEDSEDEGKSPDGLTLMMISSHPRDDLALCRSKFGMILNSFSLYLTPAGDSVEARDRPLSQA